MASKAYDVNCSTVWLRLLVFTLNLFIFFIRETKTLSLENENQITGHMRKLKWTNMAWQVFPVFTTCILHYASRLYTLSWSMLEHCKILIRSPTCRWKMWLKVSFSEITVFFKEGSSGFLAEEILHFKDLW